MTAIVAPQAVDIDADGTCELAFVNVAGKLAVHSVAATGTWTSVVSMPSYSGSVRTYVHADFDGDGDGDFVVFTGATGPQNLRLLRASGGNAYVAGPTTALTPGSIVASAQCAAVDVDQDGDLDLAYARALPTGIQIARNDGTGAFTLDTTPLPTASPFAIADLDGDRDGDLVGFSVVGHMTTLTNDGSGQYLTSVPDSIVARNAIAIRLAHVDGDDAIDALVATYDATAPAGLAVRVLTALGIDGGGFKAAPGTTPQNTNYPALAVGDVDTDGVLEAVRSIASQLETSEWDGNLGFASPKIAIAPASDRIELVDLNQDGLLDCVGDARLASNQPFGISVSMNQHGALSNAVSIFASKPAVLGHQSDFALGDYDGDADLDAVVVGWPTAAGLQVHALRQMVNQNGALVPVQALVPATTMLDGNLDHIATADADNDGDLDLFVGNVGSNASDVALLIGDGQGGFVPTSALPIKLSSQSQSLRVIDLDGDGAVDVFGSDLQNKITVLYGVGNGSFATNAVLAGLPGFTRDVRFADFDDDGLLDAFAVRDPNGVPFVRQTTPRSFAPVQHSSGGTKLLDAVPVDLDGDGRADLVGIRDGTLPPFAMPRLCSGPTMNVAHACAGSGGFEPTLSVQNCPIAGSSLEFTIDDALGDTRGFLLISTGVTPIPFKTGCALDLNFPVTNVATFATSGFGPGNGEASIAYPLPLALAGTTFAAQAVVRDPASPNQAVVTNAVVVEVE
ncbi:MAG: VCBS repeat-containing protein [Planctomycetes bacterium]|nr:VCBS repeat-containing protein [Planctomycetota bacterium]